MKKAVIKYGLISGGISAALLCIVSLWMAKGNYEHGLVVGYTCMLISFIVIYFGMAYYRDNVGGGQIGYGRALVVGLLITVISCLCYSLAWVILSKTILPADFMDKCYAYMIDQAKHSGASAEKIDAQVKEMNNWKEMGKNPVMAFLMYSIEPIPVGVLVSLISAGIVRRKKR